MDPVTNPFRPGAGRRPPVLAGRQDLLDAFDVVVRRSEELGEGDRSWVLTGLRGVGKTVILNELLARVSSRGWITAKVEAGPAADLPVALSQALVRGMRTATGRHPEPRLTRLLGVFRAFSLRFDPAGLSVGVDIDPIRGIADSGRFADDLAALFEVLGETSRSLGVGTLILIDELQQAQSPELGALNTAVHQIGQVDVPAPVIVVGAGLPSLPAQVARATSYAERLYAFHTVGPLDDWAAVQALTEPTRALGVEWHPDALAQAVESARGYAYLLQTIGKHVWDLAASNPISVDDVQTGLIAARREVDDGLYRSRWDRATSAQRDVLRALAELGVGAAPVADVARAAGRERTSDINTSRTQLIQKGLLYAPERGFLAFTVPGMDEFVQRQD